MCLGGRFARRGCKVVAVAWGKNGRMLEIGISTRKDEESGLGERREGGKGFRKRTLFERKGKGEEKIRGKGKER